MYRHVIWFAGFYVFIYLLYCYIIIMFVYLMLYSIIFFHYYNISIFTPPSPCHRSKCIKLSLHLSHFFLCFHYIMEVVFLIFYKFFFLVMVIKLFFELTTIHDIIVFVFFFQIVLFFIFPLYTLKSFYTF